MQSETYSLLEDHAQAWLRLVLDEAQSISSKNLWGKHQDEPFNKWSVEIPTW